MISHNAFLGCCLVWFFGWGILSLKYPVKCYRLLSRGREPSTRNLKMVKIVGYMGLGFGAMTVLELVFGLMR